MLAERDPGAFIVRPDRVAAAAGLVALVVGVMVLGAWATGNEELKAVGPGWPTMKANAALGFAALGLGLLATSRGWRRTGTTGAGLAIALGALTLVEYVLGVSFGIDEMLFADTGSAVGTTSPGRMAVLSAADFVLIGLAVATWGRSGRATAIGVFAASLFALFNLAFYFLGAIPPIEGTRMAIHTAAVFVVLGAGILLGRPGELARTFLGKGLAAADARSLVVAVVAFPLVAGWLAKRLFEQGILDEEQRSSFALFANLVVLSVLVVAALMRLSREAEEREATARELERSLRRIDDAEQVTGRGSWEWNVTDDRATWSKGMYRLFGLDPKTFVNSNENFLALVHPDDRARLGQAITEALAKPGPFRQEYRLKRPDGAQLHIRAEGNVVTDAHGGPTVLYGVVQDVTAVRELEQAKARAQERFARVFEASPVAIGLTREDGRLVDANAALAQLTGYSREELVAPTFSSRDLYDSPQERDRFLAALRSAGEVRGVEVGLRRKGGEVRTVLLSLEFVDLGGSTTILSLMQDVTELRRAQEEREARIASEAELERLRRTDQFRTEFINNTAHELRTPMTPLLFSLATLQHRLGSDAAAAKELASLQRAADRLRQVVGDMVSAADIQARAITLDRQRLDLTRQLKAAVAGHLEAAQRANLTLQEPEPTKLAVLADEQRLQLVLGHLLGNAIKFTPAGGSIHVSARRDGDDARIEVTDTGIGLTQRQIDGLWRPYAQAHDKSQKTDSGSGLGLYLVKGIVDLHKGEVGCSSAGPSKGSTFWFTLPLAPGS